MGWHWFSKPYRFQVYNSIKHHLYTELCTHHPKQSLFLSLFPTHPTLPHPTPPLLCLPSPSLHPPFPLAITTLLSVSMGYACMFFGYSLHLLLSSTPTAIPSCQSIPCIHAPVSVLFSVYFVHYIPHISEIIWNLSFFWLAYFT